MKLYIKSVDIRGFRAFERPLTLEFQCGINLVVGPVGSGKTSILKAIEFCLYGTVSEIKRRIYRKADIINDFSEAAEVTVELASSEKSFKITRTYIRKGFEQLKVQVGEKLLEGEPAEAEVQKIIGLTHEDFARHVFLDYHRLQEIIFGSPATRSLAIDKHLGLYTIERVFRSIPLGLVKEKLDMLAAKEKELKEELDSLPDREELVREIGELEEEARNYDRTIPELEERIKKLKKTLEEQAQKKRIYDELKTKQEKIEAIIEHYRRTRKIDPKTASDLLSALYEKIKENICEGFNLLYNLKKCEELTQKLEEKGTQLETIKLFEKYYEELEKEFDRFSTEIEELERERLSKDIALRNIEKEISVLQASKLEYEELEDELARLTEKYGSEKVLGEKLSQLEREIERLKNKMRSETCKVLLQKSVLEGKSDTCPICEQKIENIDEFREKYRKAVKNLSKLGKEKLESTENKLEEYRKAYDRIRLLRRRLVELEEVVAKYAELEATLEKAKKELEELEETLEDRKRLQVKIKGILRGARAYIKKASSLATALAGWKDITRLQKELEALSKNIDKLNFDPAEYEILENEVKTLTSNLENYKARKEEIIQTLEDKRGTLAEIERLNAELAAISQKEKEIERFYKRLLKVRRALREAQSELRSRVIEELKERINEAFRAIYRYGDYEELDIRVENIRTEKGYPRSIYRLLAKRTRDGQWVPILPRLSDGQKSLIALIFAVAVHGLAENKPDFVILDEPAPNIDEVLKRSVAIGLQKLGMQQVIIATQSEILKTENAKIISLKQEMRKE